MSVSLGRNISALRAERSLAQNSSRLDSVLERLSSGTRLNRPSDDAAGLSISSALGVGARVFTQGIRNINDGISAINIADSTLEVLGSITVRQRELALQAASGSLSLSQRQALNAEANELVDEFNRLASATRFNGLRLLAGGFGDFRIQGDFGTNGGISFRLGEELDRGVGTGSFSQGTSYAIAGNTAQGAILVDLNGDGEPDLVSAASTGANGGRIEVRLGNGDGTFGSASAVVAGGLGTTFYGLASGDFNGDGFQDIAYLSSDILGDSYGATVRMGNGSGGFGGGVVVGGHGTAINSLRVADFDGDGRSDVAFSTGTGVNFFRSTGSNFTAAGSYSGAYTDFRVGDIDGDSQLDVVVRDSSSSFRVLTNTGGFAFSVGSSVSTGGNFSTLAIADLNRDGRADVVTDAGGSNGLRILLGQSGGEFSLSTLATGIATSTVQVGDVNGDGNPDIVASHNGAYVRFVGLGDGSLIEQGTTTNSGVTSMGAFALGDVNGDGSLDIVTSEAASGATRSLVLTQSSAQVSSQQYMNLANVLGARDAIGVLESVLDRISLERGILGANLSRLGSFQETLSAKAAAYREAESRISDADVAGDSANLTRLQILQDAGAAVLAQASAQPSLVLTLLSAQ